MSEMLRAPVLIENRSGAAGMFGAGSVAKAAPDGHTLLFTIMPLVQSPIMLGQAPCDSVRDCMPIGKLRTMVLVCLCLPRRRRKFCLPRRRRKPSPTAAPPRAFAYRGAAARVSRSLIAAPRP